MSEVLTRALARGVGGEGEVMAAIFVHGLDVVPFLIAGTCFPAAGGAFVLFMALFGRLLSTSGSSRRK